MDPLRGLLGVAVIVAVAVATRGFVRSTGLRRRLFVAIALATLLPAAAVATLLVSNVRTVLSLLEAPGLREGVDAGLDLARAWLETEDRLLRATAAEVGSALEAGVEAPVPADGVTGWRVNGDVAFGIDLEPWLVGGEGSEGPGSRRVTTDAGTALLTTVTLSGNRRLTVGRRIPDTVARDLQRVREGSAGFRQLELYYRPLLGTSLLIVVVITLLAIALVGTWLGRDVSARLVRPLGDLVDGTRRVAAGDLSSRVETRAVGEVVELVDAFNTMTFRLAEGERRLRRSERLAAWQGIARRLAHEIKNPLTPIQLATHRLRRRTDDPVATESLAAIEEEVVNLQRLAEEFSALGRLPDPRPEPVGLHNAIAQAVELYVPDTIATALDVPDDVVVWADPGQLRQVTSNLVKNAVQALGTKGNLAIVARAERGAVHLIVEDDGPGLGDDPDRVFDAGYTTRSTGTGLGLAIVQRIVEDHGGTIEAGRAAAGGARFDLRWPARDPAVGGEDE